MLLHSLKNPLCVLVYHTNLDLFAKPLLMDLHVCNVFLGFLTKLVEDWVWMWMGVNGCVGVTGYYRLLSSILTPTLPSDR